MFCFAFRGPANEWYDALCIHMRNSKTVRSWFVHNVLFSHTSRFAEYLLECPSSEVCGFLNFFFNRIPYIFSKLSIMKLLSRASDEKNKKKQLILDFLIL